MRIVHIIATLAIVCSFVNTKTTSAAIEVYEGFDYEVTPPFELAGNNGGTGFSTAWESGGFNAGISSNYLLEPGSLIYPGLATSGNYVTSAAVDGIAGITRELSTPLGAANTTRYISFLLRPEGNVGGGFFGLVLEDVNEPELFVGKPGGGNLDDYVAENRGGALQVTTGAAATVGETTLIVIKAEFTSAGNDIFTVYVNPTVGGPEPIMGTVKNDANVGIVSGLTIYSSDAFSIDEIRIGTTFGDVTPGTPVVPEPTSIAIAMGLVGAFVLIRRRK
jgi:hypothetical protein